MHKRSTTTLRFRLGDHVRFRDTVEKVRNDDITSYASAGLPRTIEGGRVTNPEFGIVVGHRVLMEHRTSYSYEDGMFGSYSVRSTKPVEGSARIAWLVAYELRRKPVIVFDDDITPADREREPAPTPRRL